MKGLTMPEAYPLLSVLALTMSLPAYAQDTVTGIRRLNDRLEDNDVRDIKTGNRLGVSLVAGF
jgi:hypothetical protein